MLGVALAVMGLVDLDSGKTVKSVIRVHANRSAIKKQTTETACPLWAKISVVSLSEIVSCGR